MLTYISYKENNVYQAALVNAATIEEAEKFFRSQKPFAELFKTREAFPGDQKPGMSVMVAPEKDANDFKPLADIIRDAEGRKGWPGGPGDPPPGGAGALEIPKKKEDEILDSRKVEPIPVYVAER